MPLLFIKVTASHWHHIPKRQSATVVMNMDLEVRLPLFKSSFCHSSVM